MNKRRVTPEQMQGDIGQLQLHEHFKQHGWEPRSLTPDLGEDFIIDIYDAGVSAGLGFYAQVKSSEKLSKYKLKDGNFSYPLEVKDLSHWRDYVPTVVLFLWDTTQRCGYWLTVPEIVKELEKIGSGWEKNRKVQVQIPATNTTAPKSLKVLRQKLAVSLFPILAEQEPMSINCNFEFPPNESGNKTRDAVQRFLDTGEGMTIHGRFIKGMRLSELYGRKYGDLDINRKGKIIFGDLKSDRIEKLRIDLLSEDKRIIHVQAIEVKPVQVGIKQVTLSNEHQPTPFAFKLVVRQSGELTYSFSLKETRTTTVGALEACDFFDAAENARYFRVQPLTNKTTWGNLGELEAPINQKNFLKIQKSYRGTLEKLRDIESKTGVSFLLTDKGIREEDWKEIHRVSQILKTGRIRSHFDRMQQTLRGPKEPDYAQVTARGLLESYKSDEFVAMSGQQEDTLVQILGVEVLLGEVRFEIHGKVADECVNYLKSIADSKDEIVEMDLVLEKGNFVQEYTEWLTSPQILKLPSENESEVE